MGIELTNPARAALAQTLKTPSLVLKIEGIDTLYGADVIKDVARIGNDLEIGDPEINPKAFYVGGIGLNPDQSTSITFNGTSTSIKQTLDPSKGQGSNVSTLSVALIDKGDITELITPGVVIEDILQRKCMIYLGFEGTAWPEDYSVIFRGFITDITSDAGKTVFQINGTNERLRSSIYTQATVNLLNQTLSASDTTMVIDKIDNVLAPITGVNRQIDPTFRAYFKIEEEIIGYSSITANANQTYTVNNLVRGAINSTPASHQAGSMDTYYRLTGNAIDLALKLMTSGLNEAGLASPFRTLDVTSINVGGVETFQNTLFFSGLINDNDLGLTIGDFISVTGSANPLVNDVSQATILDLIQGENGLFVRVQQPLVTEASTSAKASFYSQWATLPDGCSMAPDEIDIAQFLKIKRLYLSGVTLDFYLKDSIDSAKNFIEEEILMPLSAYSIPRRSQSSVGYFAGPIPGTDIVTFDEDGIKNPSSLQIKRSTNSNFYNEIVYKYDDDPVEDQFNSGYIAISQASKNRIFNSPNKTLVIESKGLRSLNGARSIVTDQAKRRFNRYQYGAETFTFSSSLGVGYTVEVGDIVIFDGSSLQLPDSKTGRKGLEPRLLEIQNKEIQLKTGDLRFTAIDTNFDGAGRHGLISPSSQILSGQSTTQFTLYSYSDGEGSSPLPPEYLKWNRLVGAAVQVRSPDFAQRSIANITKVDGNQIEVSPALSFTPTLDMVLEFAPYSSPTKSMVQHLVYGYMSNGPFADTTQPYTMI